MPSPTISTLVLIFVVLAITISLFINHKKKKIYVELITLIEDGDSLEFESKINDKMTRLLFNPFQLDYLRLNEAIISTDSKKIEEALSIFDKRRLNDKQKEDIYMKGFNYYISIENKQGAKKYLDLINELPNEQMKKETNIIYDTYIMKGHHYLDEIIEETEELEDTYKGVNEFLISKMYENKNDEKMAKEYYRRAEKHMKLLDDKLKKEHKEKKDNKTI